MHGQIKINLLYIISLMNKLPDYTDIIADIEQKLSFAKADYTNVPTRKNLSAMKTLEFHLAKWRRLYARYLFENPDKNQSEQQNLNLF